MFCFCLAKGKRVEEEEGLLYTLPLVDERQRQRIVGYAGLTCVRVAQRRDGSSETIKFRDSLG